MRTFYFFSKLEGRVKILRTQNWNGAVTGESNGRGGMGTSVLKQQ